MLADKDLEDFCNILTTQGFGVTHTINFPTETTYGIFKGGKESPENNYLLYISILQC